MGTGTGGVTYGRRNIRLHQAVFIDTGSLSCSSAFYVAAQGVRKGFHNLVSWLKHEQKGGPQ